DGAALPSVPISTVESRSNDQERPRGGRYFIYRPPQVSDPAGAMGSTVAAPSRAPPLDSRDQNRSRGVPAFQGDGAAINCHGRTPSQARGVARRSTDGRCGRVYWATRAAGRVCWWARIRRPGGGGAPQEWRRAGVGLKRAAARWTHGRVKRHGGHRVAARPAA
ncbi:hypothetical protein PVAP13_6KG358406, partial [Panicum virgatum]